jgi:hypothetical protein
MHWNAELVPRVLRHALFSVLLASHQQFSRLRFFGLSQFCVVAVKVQVFLTLCL